MPLERRGDSQTGVDEDEEERERIMGCQLGLSVRMPWTMERPREGEVPPAIATVGIVSYGSLPVLYLAKKGLGMGTKNGEGSAKNSYDAIIYGRIRRSEILWNITGPLLRMCTKLLQFWPMSGAVALLLMALRC